MLLWLDQISVSIPHELASLLLGLRMSSPLAWHCSPLSLRASRPALRTCSLPMQFFCMRSFRGPVCPDWLQEQLLGWMIESAERGRPGFREMLTMTPCDLFSLVRGRTLWLMGDSMMQVGPAGSLQGRPSRLSPEICDSLLYIGVP